MSPPTSRVREKNNSASSADLRTLLNGEIVHLYQNNPFRVLNIPADSTLRQAEKKVQRLNVLRQIDQKAADEFLVRDAMQTLRDPQRRLLAELFWFTLDAAPDSLDQQAMQKLREGNWQLARQVWYSAAKQPRGEVTRRAVHNLAVLMHARVVTLEAGRNPLWKSMTANAPLPEDVVKGWHEALKLWSTYWRDVEAWDYWNERVRATGDRRISENFVADLRELLPDALLQVNRDLARRYADAGFGTPAGEHCRMMRQSGFSTDLSLQHARTVIDPIRRRIINACDALKQNAETHKNSATLLQLVTEFGRNYGRDVQLLTQIDDKKEFGAAAAREVIARTLKFIAIELVTGGKRAYQPSIETLQKAQAFADSRTLQNELRDLLKSVEFEKNIWQLAPKSCVLCTEPPADWEVFKKERATHGKLAFLCKRHATSHDADALLRAVTARWSRLPTAPPPPPGVGYEYP